MFAAIEGVAAGFAVEAVISFAAIESIIATTPQKRVVARHPLDGIRGGIADEKIAFGSPLDHQLLDGGNIPNGAVGKPDLFHSIVVGFVFEPLAYRDSNFIRPIA